EHAGAHPQLEAAERGAAEDQLQRLARLAPCGRGLEARVEVLRELVEQDERPVRACGVGDQRPGVDARRGDARRAEARGGPGEGGAQAKARPPSGGPSPGSLSTRCRAAGAPTVGPGLLGTLRRAVHAGPSVPSRAASASRASRSARREESISSPRSPARTCARLFAL